MSGAATTVAATDRVERHAFIDRVPLGHGRDHGRALLATGLLPVIGIHFAWLDIHAISGVLLTR